MKTEFQLKGEISWTATIRTAGIGVHTLWMSHMSCLLQGGLTLPTNLWSPAKTLHAKSQETNPTFESRVGCNLLYVTPHITWILQFPSFQFLRGWCLNPKHWKVPLKSTTIDWTLKENYLWTNKHPFRFGHETNPTSQTTRDAAGLARAFSLLSDRLGGGTFRFEEEMNRTYENQISLGIVQLKPWEGRDTLCSRFIMMVNHQVGFCQGSTVTTSLPEFQESFT